jgi:hypothetical protein
MLPMPIPQYFPSTFQGCHNPNFLPRGIFMLLIPFPHHSTTLQVYLTFRHAMMMMPFICSFRNKNEQVCHLKLPSPWNVSVPLPTWTWQSPRASALYAKHEHKTSSCAFNSSKASPFLIAFLFDSMTWSSCMLSLKVFTFTDPLIRTTKISSLIFQPLFSSSASLATFSRLMIRMSCCVFARDSPRSL